MERDEIKIEVVGTYHILNNDGVWILGIQVRGPTLEYVMKEIERFKKERSGPNE